MSPQATIPTQAGRRQAPSVESIVQHLSGGRGGRKYRVRSKVLRTWRRYFSAFKLCEQTAEDLGVCLFPFDDDGRKVAADPEVLEIVLEAIVENGGVVGSISTAKAALKAAYRLRGHPPADWDQLREFMQGIRREKGVPERQARPLLADDLVAILDIMDPTNPRHVRNAAILALGWAAAMRADEIVTAGWEAPGIIGKSAVTTHGGRIAVHFDTAKTTKDGKGQDVSVPTERAPLVMTWLNRWAQIAGREPGRLIFAQMSRSGRIIGKPMSPVAITKVVRDHVRAYLLANGMEKVAAATAARHFRSHSLRVGYAVSSAAAGIPEAVIRAHCRHKSALTTARYTEQAARLSGLSLKGLLRK